MDHKDIIEIIECLADFYKVDKNLAVAIASVESKFDAWAARFEPKWKYFVTPEKYSRSLGITLQTETMFQQTSWGLMQVMGSVMRELGYQDHLNSGAAIEVGARYGCAKLKTLLNRYPKEEDAISAYNAGSLIVADGKYKNQQYVDKVNEVLSGLRIKH